MKIILRVWLIALCVLALCSCATFFGDKTRIVQITSEPSGANIYVNGVLYGKTPGKIILADAGYDPHKIIVALPGFESQTVMVNTQFQNVGYFNLICPIGFIADYTSDTMFKLDPRDLKQDINLKKINKRVKNAES